MVMRNFAFYFHKQDHPLKDIGYEIVPRLSADYHLLPEAIIYLNHFGATAVLLVLFFSKREPHWPYFVNIGLRILKLLTIGHTLRALSFTVTSLPGQAPHCVEGGENYYPPKDLVEVFFTHFSWFGKQNCGDLIFSGHIFNQLTFTQVCNHYWNQIFEAKFSKIMCWYMWVLTFIQCFIVIAIRNHYSVDVVVAFYTGIMLYRVFTQYSAKDHIPSQNEKIQEKLIES